MGLITEKAKLLSGYASHIRIGCDPEIFLSRKGQIIGSECIITPEIQAIKAHNAEVLAKAKARGNYWEGIILDGAKPDPIPQVISDGVQVEFQPTSATCRASLGSYLRRAISALGLHIADHYPDVSMDFSQVVDVTEEEFEGLSDRSKVLGCAPSLNIYDESATIGVEPANYRTRSGAGHIHIGWPADTKAFAETMRSPEVIIKLVKVLDILVGTIGVLLDRDPRAAERRRVYGRAGEYRLPAHGLEYRTPSNFWLRSYPLASLMWGLARLSTAIVYHSEAGVSQVTARDSWGTPIRSKTEKMTWMEDLFSRVDQQEIREIINLNDFDRALKSYAAIRGFLFDYTEDLLTGASDGLVPLVRASLEDFDYLIARGIDHFWPASTTLLRWVTQPDGHGQGWEATLSGRIRAASAHLGGLTESEALLKESQGGIMDLQSQTDFVDYVRMRFRRATNGVNITVQVLPEVEELLRSWGTGEIQDCLAHGRSWQPVGDTPPLRVHHLQTNYGIMGSPGALWRVDRVGAPLGSREEDDDGTWANLSFLRLVGISSPEGVSFQLRGAAYSYDGLQTIGKRIQTALRAFTIAFLKPYDITMLIQGARENR